jgi:AcrR family transcriptional regulator
MRDIADACGLLAGSLYSHFRSKAEILELIIDPFYDQLVPAQEAAAALDGTGAERTEDMLRRVFQVLVACNEEMTIIHYDWPDLQSIPDFAGILDRSNYILELWYRVITAGIADGTLRSEIDPEMTVRVITSSLFGVLDQKRYAARTSPLAEGHLNELVDEFVLMMVSGLRSDGPVPKAATATKQTRKVKTTASAGTAGANGAEATPTKKRKAAGESRSRTPDPKRGKSVRTTN